MANNSRDIIRQRQETIVSFVKSQKTAPREAIQEFITKKFPQSSKLTILRDLDALVADGKVFKQGKARATTYVFQSTPILETFDTNRYFSVLQDDRKLISNGFNFDVWDNLHDILSAKEKVELATLNDRYLKALKELPPSALRKEMERITIELSWKSSQIEGNTYTLLDTEELIKVGIEAKGKTHEEAIMILNHKKAIEFVFEKPGYFKKITLSKIEDLHRLLIAGLEVDFGIRNYKVGITGTKYKPLDNKYQIREAIEKLADTINVLENPIEKALVAALMISYIQPFADGNKRTARILGNAILMAGHYCPLSYRSVDEGEYKKAILMFYEQNSAYYFKQIFTNQFKFAVETYF
ncbi:MAG: Fic family protein [Rickettsiales bacterium]|jgi:hypothetical protein|nr:Fic family protein [Rickettsiales bacterium]